LKTNAGGKVTYNNTEYSNGQIITLHRLAIRLNKYQFQD
jgi:hypothetical protein